MKICFISEAKSIHAQKWVASIAARASEVHLISRSTAQLPGVMMHQMPLYDKKPLNTLRNVLAVRLLLRKINPDIIQVCGLFSISSTMLLPLLLGLRKKKVVVSPWGSDIIFVGEHDGEREGMYSRFMKWFLLGRSRIITASSYFLMSHIRRYHRHRPIVYIPFGVDVELFKPVSLISGTKSSSVIHIGITKKLSKIYGHSFLLQALPAVIQSCSPLQIRLTIIGSGELEEELKRLTTELQLQDHVHFIP
ncbi:MAG: glycosyltransferase, partial [Chitinivibrionales bacterium]|nr:glycosyltransferase [Chitinivibrionales bacterium]